MSWLQLSSYQPPACAAVAPRAPLAEVLASSDDSAGDWSSDGCGDHDDGRLARPETQSETSESKKKRKKEKKASKKRDKKEDRKSKKSSKLDKDDTKRRRRDHSRYAIERRPDRGGRSLLICLVAS